VNKSKQIGLLERYQSLLEITRDLASTLRLDTLLDRIVHAAADLCAAEGASILLYDAAKQQLYFQAASNLETPLLRGLVVPVDASIAGWIVTERKPVNIPDASQDPRHYKQVSKSTKVKTKSLLGVPLIAKGQVIGVLEAINKFSGQFSDEDQELLMALGAQAAIAIENAKLFQQSDLISELIHELRTPLASLNAAAYLLLRPEVSQEQRNSIIKTIRAETNRLNEMASAFLDLARLESGRARFLVDKIHTDKLIADCAAVMISKIKEKNQTLIVNVAEGIPVFSGDQDKLKQVIINLLSNAAKYTPEGGTIELSAETKNGEAVITVKDNGPGIHDDYLPRIFERFFRVPGSERNASGTGLGLSICKRIVEAHNGRIEVETTVGAGSAFTVFIPLKVIGDQAE